MQCRMYYREKLRRVITALVCIYPKADIWREKHPLSIDKNSKFNGATVSLSSMIFIVRHISHVIITTTCLLQIHQFPTKPSSRDTSSCCISHVWCTNLKSLQSRLIRLSRTGGAYSVCPSCQRHRQSLGYDNIIFTPVKWFIHKGITKIACSK